MACPFVGTPRWQLLLPFVVLLTACVAPLELGDDEDLAQLALVYDDTIITESARTVDFNGQAFVPRHLVAELSDGDDELHVRTALARVVLGLDEHLTLAVNVPEVSKRRELADPAPGMPSVLESDGLGDVSTILKWRWYQRTGRAETTEAAWLGGVKLPTGSDDEKDAGVELPPGLQPGSGSTDAVLGAAFTRIKDRWLLNADLIAKWNSEHESYRFGHSLRADIGGHYRLRPARYERFDQTTVNLVAELNAEWSLEDRLDGDRVDDTGGRRLFLTPGLQVIIGPSALLEAALQIPVHEDMHGDQLDHDGVLILGLRLRF